MKSKLRIISLLLVVFMLALVALSGCGSSKPAAEEKKAEQSVESTKAAASTAAETKKSGEKVKIRFFTRNSGTDKTTELFNKLVDQFNNENPDVQVVHEGINDSVTYENKLKTDLATGNVPHIFTMAGIANLLDLAKAGTIMDLTPLIEDKEWSGGFAPGVFEQFDLTQYGCKGIYSMAWTRNYEPFYYNVALFKKAGIEKTPETWDDFYQVIDKLKAIGVVPWAVGAKNSWRIGHVHTGIVYKMLGVQAAKDLGLRNKKYTDPDVVNTFKFIVDLKNKGAFEKGFEGVDYEAEKAMFYTQKAAMTFDGTWRLADIYAKKLDFEVGAFQMPYFKDKADLRYNDITYPSQFCLSGKMEGKEKDAAVKFIKWFYNKDNSQLRFDYASSIPTRADVKVDGADVPKLTQQILTDVGKNVQVPGHDVFAYDPLPNMLNTVWDALIGSLVGGTPEAACEQIQKEVERQLKKK